MGESTEQITDAGKAALYLLGEGDDPRPQSKAAETFSIPLPESV